MKKCTLVVKDFVNVKFNDLDPVMRRQLSKELQYKIPNAAHIARNMIGRWDGTVSFCTAGGATYVNLLDRIIHLLDDYDIEVIDNRPEYEFDFPEVDEDFLSHIVWPEKHKKAGEPIVLEDHQVHIINSCLNNPRAVIEAGTGAGKTISTAALSWIVEPYGRTIVVVPNKGLIKATEKDYKLIGLDVGVYYGDRKEWNHKHTICTWQSLSIYSKNTDKGEVIIPLQDFIKDVVCVICDEAHMAKGKELKSLLTGPFAHIPLRWGLTGTIPPEEHEKACLLAGIGPKVAEVNTYDLQDTGFLAKCDVDIVQTIDDHVAFSNYADEQKYLLKDEGRLTFIAKYLEKLADDHGNTLVLVDRIETGQRLQKLIVDSAFISGKVKLKDREKEYDSFHLGNNKVTIATYGVAAVGISIDRIFNLVFIEPGKSFVRTVQSIGRGLRTAQDKNYVKIIDLTSSLKYSKRHLAKRKTFYNDKKWPHSTKKISYLA
jgi:superfamily II DNA or RNA helicase